jgi:hypothetical protein
MNPDDPMADEVLRRTLIEVRSARTRRRAVRGSLAALALLIPAVVLFMRPPPQAVSVPAVVMEPRRELPPAADEKIAVMVWHDGSPRLEWRGLRDLGTVELELSLEPVFAFADSGD